MSRQAISIEILLTSMTFQQRERCRNVPNIVESDVVVKTTVAVSKYHLAPTARLFASWTLHTMDTDEESLSFPVFPGLSQLTQCK